MLGGRRGTPRGDLLLLAHLAALDRLTAGNGTTPRARLEAKLGPELARLVLGSVGAAPARRPVAPS